MTNKKHKVAIIGCGRMGQHYAQAYRAYPDTEIVGIVEHNADRRKAVGERFEIQNLYATTEELLNSIVPDIAAIITPSKFYKDAVIACAEAGVKGISTDKPIAAKLSDADLMVEMCKSKGIVLAGGNLQRAMHEIQEAAQRIRDGQYGEIKGASLNGFGGEISGGGCQAISVLRLMTNSEIQEVMCWGTHMDVIKGNADRQQAIEMSKAAINQEDDTGIVINGRFTMESGISRNVFGTATPYGGVDVWSDSSLIRWNWGPPQIFQGFDDNGNRIEVETNYKPYEFSEFRYLTGSIRSFIKAIDTGSEPWITGHDLRQALEVAIASKLSAQLGSVPVKLPLADRSHSLLPRPYRWIGGDETGRYQSVDEARQEIPDTN